MKITKYEHACLVLEEQGSHLVIDPGDFSNSLPDLDNVLAIIITHVHFDHLNSERVARLVANNPNVKILSVQQVKEKLPSAIVKRAGETEDIGPFHVAFFGGEHAIIHPEYPRFENLGILVNESFYYGGDSLDLPGNIQPEVVAVPTSGPWSKTSEQMDYIAALKPTIAIAVHDFLGSEAGNESQDRWLSIHAEKHGVTYKHLTVGESIDAR
jgi:L-ascorbate metabolism protein UlaG (beta-lactamase superfamily)